MKDFVTKSEIKIWVAIIMITVTITGFLIALKMDSGYTKDQVNRIVALLDGQDGLISQVAILKAIHETK